MAPSTESPHSSAQEDSIHTPNTGLSPFSPEGVRITDRHYVVVSSVPGKHDTQNDPFVVVGGPNIKGGQSRLSPIAATFSPKGKQQGPLPGTVEHVMEAIDQGTSGAPYNDPDISPLGQFTTTTLKTRNFRIFSLYGNNAMAIVEGTILQMEDSNINFMGQRRIATAGPSIVLKLDNIEDVTVVHNALQASGELSLEFISAPEFARLVSPINTAHCSAHESEILLRVPYAAKPSGMSKKEFGQSLIDILSSEGNIVAFKRLPDLAYLCIVAEYADVTKAARAVALLNGKAIGTGLNKISVSPYEPDLANSGTMTRYQPPIQTPTRRGEDFGLVNAISSMNILGVNGQFSPIQLASVNNAGHSGSGYVIMTPGFGQNQSTIFPPQYQISNFGGPSSPFGYSPPGLPLGYYGSPQDQRVVGYRSPVSGRRGNGNRAMTPSRGRGFNQNNNHHNMVDVGRIRSGLDVRTTVMLRNIPNKVDQAMLKAIIDESSFGRYDFLYLRIDFSNNCNVGYAFINFVDPVDIVDFVQIRANKPWLDAHRCRDLINLADGSRDSFKSDKIAEVSYATIQGKDCLIQKFRNSSVMLEPAHYRPKLFFTWDNVERVGEEDEFPASDNASKLKRSCENAEHVGLFAPSAGQHMRDEQRRRRSQFDRGTSLAAREEEFHNEVYGYPQY